MKGADGTEGCPEMGIEARAGSAPWTSPVRDPTLAHPTLWKVSV